MRLTTTTPVHCSLEGLHMVSYSHSRAELSCFCDKLTTHGGAAHANGALYCGPMVYGMAAIYLPWIATRYRHGYAGEYPV